ncbi:hypothetical protein F4825DRAFT_462382 [Nemania diffusa]|nr:hypothetical protein F4825DRAFT_462382 [Nemania diffusa]
MDNIPEELRPKSVQEKYLDVAYKERWEHLKQVIIELYIGNYGKGGRATTLTQLADFMKTYYSFHATPNQYRTHFESWDIKKNVRKDTKDDVINTLAKRKRPRASTSHVTLANGRRDQQLPPSKLIRYVKGQSHRLPAEPMIPGLLSSWNLPYEAFIASIRQNKDKPSPFGPLASTPDGLVVESPSPLTPGREADGPSPNMQLVYRKAMEKHYSSCKGDLRNSLFLWAEKNATDILEAPTQLCNWSIHISAPRGDAHCDSPIEEPYEQPSTSFAGELRQSILSNNFTGSPCEDFPLSEDLIARAIENDPQALKLDAWKLAIMAANFQLLDKLSVGDDGDPPEGLDDIYPLHLAASFLDAFILDPTYAFYHNVDNLGHTILDALIASILRSHTTITPDFVSYGFHSSNRFPGEEMDMCGRWSPDTPRVHDLFRQGFHRIPDTWKHPFCHTSVQAVCHNINKLSGLFTRRCMICGLELKLAPLHALVVATFCLAQHGMSGETLGADATLTVNISAEEILGVSDVAECHHTHLSPSELMLRVPENVVNKWSDDCRLGWNCFAGILSRAEKREDPHPQVNSDRDKEYQSGEDSDDSSTTSTNEGCDIVMDVGEEVHGDWLKLKCHDADMGLLWATIQTEILTYRRVNEGDLWVSKNFSMRALDAWLSSSSVDFLTSLVADRMMQEHSKYGWFHKTREFACPTAQDVSATYFMNMDIYQRATYIESPDLDRLCSCPST